MGRINPIAALIINLTLDKLGLFGNDQQEEESYSEPELEDTLSVRMLKRKEGSVTLIVGCRESGKTVLGYRLAELLGRPIYAVSPEENPPSGIAELKFEELDEQPPPRSTLFLDDLPAYMGSRDYQNRFVQVVERLVPIVRHKRKLHLIFSTQLASLSDKYAMDADCVIFKPPSLLYEDIERASVRRRQDAIAHIWEGKSEDWIHRHCYILSHREKGLVGVQKPTFM